MSELAQHPRTMPNGDAWTALRWIAATLGMAWLAPFAVVAIVAALCSLFGVTTSGVRLNVVGLASLEAGEWASVGVSWNAFVWACGIAVVTWRVWNARPVRAKREALATRFADGFGAVTDRVVEPLVTRFEGLPRSAQVGAVVAGMVAFFLFLAAGLPSHQRSAVPVAPTKMPVPPSSAALLLPGGLVRSGDVSVQQQGRDTYVVVFKASDVQVSHK